jgi:hypothetical protein
MKMTNVRTWRWLGLGAAALVGGCGDAPGGAAWSSGAELGQARAAIIGGFHATSHALDLMGALVSVNPSSGAVNSFCGATLIGAQTAVTAKHCAEDVRTLAASGLELFFGVGPDGLDSDVLVPIAALEFAPGDTGGFLGIGRDVGVVHLDFSPGIEPAEPRTLDASFVGVSMVSVGYGVFGASGANDDQRRIGRETVAATSGNALEVMFGSFENFVEWRVTDQITDADFLAEHATDPALIARLPELTQEFDTPLLPEHEAVAGLAPTDTQTCLGDSGGPLALIDAAGRWQVYGVASAGTNSARIFCDFGTLYATFGPVTLPFLQAAQAWTDPCGESDAAGSCDGAIARRCQTNLGAGTRQLVEDDCAALEQSCSVTSAGAGCVPAPAVP